MDFSIKPIRDFIETTMNQAVEKFLIENYDSIEIGNDFFKHYRILNPINSGWIAITDSESIINHNGISNIKILALKELKAIFTLMYKDDFISQIKISYFEKIKSTKIMNSNEILIAINSKICSDCKNMKTKCTCQQTNTDTISETLNINEELIKTNITTKIEDESGLFSEKKIICSIPEDKVKEIISGISKSLNYNLSDLWPVATTILEQNPKISENEFAQKLVYSAKRT